MFNLEKILLKINKCADEYTGIPIIKFFDMKTIRKFNEDELKKLWLYAKVRFITIHIMDNKELRVYELQQDGKLVLI